MIFGIIVDKFAGLLFIYFNKIYIKKYIFNLITKVWENKLMQLKKMKKIYVLFVAKIDMWYDILIKKIKKYLLLYL